MNSKIYIEDAEDLMRESKTYRDVLKHRNTCKKWGNEFCLKCFGGGLTNFLKQIKIEFYEKFVGKIEECKNSTFNGIDCLESEKQYGFFKSDTDIRPSSATWINKDDADKLLILFAKYGGQEK